MNQLKWLPLLRNGTFPSTGTQIALLSTDYVQERKETIKQKNPPRSSMFTISETKKPNSVQKRSKSKRKQRGEKKRLRARLPYTRYRSSLSWSPWSTHPAAIPVAPRSTFRKRQPSPAFSRVFSSSSLPPFAGHLPLTPPQLFPSTGTQNA